MICPPEESANYELIETICIAFFTIDYFIRLFLVALMPARLAGILPSYFDTLNANAIMPCPVYSGPITVWRYMKIPMNIIDLIAILPFYVAYFSTSGSSVSIIRILRLVRVLRVFKIGGMGNGITVRDNNFLMYIRFINCRKPSNFVDSNHINVVIYTSQLMSNAMMNSLSAMGILLFFTVLGVILFGSIIFFLEAGTFIVNEDFPEGAYLRWDVLGIAREESPFSSILVSCYWAMVTFTTVGYGDLVPTSPFGRFISLVLMYTGILVLALPISVIGANFQREYERLEGGDEDEEDNDDDDEDQPTARAPVKRGLMRSSSSSGSLTMSKRELQAAERLVKKTLQRERSKSNASAMGEEALAEAMLPVTEQLARLSFTCGKMMERIEVLQKQQNEMMLHISPSSKFEANMGMKEKKEDEEDEENSGRRDCLPPREDGIELGRVEGGAGPVGGERDERGYSRSSSEISTTNSTVGLVLNHNNSSSSY